MFHVPAHSAYRCYCIWTSDAVHMKWLVDDQSGCTDPILRNTRRITWYFLTQSLAFSTKFSCADMHSSDYTRTSFGYLSQIRKGSSVNVSQSRGYISMTAGTVRLSSGQDSFHCDSPSCLYTRHFISFIAFVTVSFPTHGFKSLYSNESIIPLGCGTLVEDSVPKR